MHPPSYARRLWLLPIAALGLGCASTGRFGPHSNDPKIRTIASIGDKPVSAVAGVPTSSAVADLEDHSAAPDRSTRVSGRVVDDQGEPVANARIRVADGGISGGRVVEANSDRAGGFTLRGLRPGSKYTLIAEYEGQGGRVEGRAEVRSPASGVEIAVQADDLPADRRRAEKAPSGRKISDRRKVDPDDPIPSRVNQDDLPEGSDADDGDDLTGPAPTAKRQQAVRVSGSGWRPSRVAPDHSAMTASAVGDRATHRASTRSVDDEDEGVDDRGKRRDDAPPPTDEDEDNPLPPAIESQSKRGRGADPGRDPDPSGARPRSTRRVSQVESKRPGPPPGALTLAKDASPTRPLPDRPDNRVAEPAQTPAAVEALPDVPSADSRAYNPFPEPKKSATWSDLSAAWNVERSGERTPAKADTIDFEPRSTSITLAPRRAEANTDRAREAKPVAAEGGPIEVCRYDAQRQEILDFRLPDLDGRPVSLDDFDSDFILLDFWGTWCRPCLSSVPHLVELQKRFDARSLTVVGIACEEGPAMSNAVHVADVAKQIGINYTLLLSSKDNSASPVQESLHIQAFPTMIVIDRTGRVVWRGQGATTETLARLDRVLASSMKVGATNAVRR